jgi:hypothetical protein
LRLLEQTLIPGNGSRSLADLGMITGIRAWMDCRCHEGVRANWWIDDQERNWLLGAWATLAGSLIIVPPIEVMLHRVEGRKSAQTGMEIAEPIIHAGCPVIPGSMEGES